MKHLLATTGAAAVLFWAAPSHAVLQFSADINGVAFACADGQACDTSAGTPNVLTTNPNTFGGVEISQTQQQAVYGPPSNALFTNSLAVHNTNDTTVTLQIAVGATGFTAPTDSFSAAGSGTWLNADGSTITMSFYGDTANAQGADTPTDAPGVLLADSGLIVAGPGADQYGFDQNGAFVTTAPFSWTMLATVELAPGETATLLGRSQDLTNAVVAVPEPASLLILGGSLTMLGLVAARRRRNKQL